MPHPSPTTLLIMPQIITSWQPRDQEQSQNMGKSKIRIAISDYGLLSTKWVATGAIETIPRNECRLCRRRQSCACARWRRLLFPNHLRVCLSIFTRNVQRWSSSLRIKGRQVGGMFFLSCIPSHLFASTARSCFRRRYSAISFKWEALQHFFIL
jgi:hypothetical protein